MTVPVPPLEVQREIVRILDSFTLLTARKKQYEYYRDILLVPPCDDVEKISLSDVVSIKNGKDYKHLKDRKYPVYGSGGIMTYKSEYTYDKPSVLIPRKGSLSNLFYVEEPFWNVDTVFYTEVNESKLIPKYLYYLLQKEHLESLNTAGGVPSLTQTVLNKLNLTIPSLNRQRKIVDCLDNFEKICNDLNIGLPAEIEARKKQYEYYRDVLLKFAETGSTILTDRQTDRQTVIKLIQYVFGYAPVKLKYIAEYSKDRVNANDVDENTYVGVDNLLQNKKGKTLSNCVPKTGRLTQYKSGDVLIGNIRPYLRKIWLADNTGGTNGDVLVIRGCIDIIIPKFLYYYLSSEDFFEYNNQYSKGAKMPRGNKDAIMEYILYIPSLEEQSRIVSILDRFDSLCNDITSGLPAEIEARKKQYEYYRDKLLDFK